MMVDMTGKKPKRNPRPGVDVYGRTALHYAAIGGDAVEVRALLDKGAVADAADDNGFTPLHFAAQSGATEVAEVLIEAGASVDSRDSHGNTPLAKAVFNSRGNGEVIKLLRNAGADPRLENEHGISPLKIARTISNFDVRKFFDDIQE
jgi:uncharacterized protein